MCGGRDFNDKYKLYKTLDNLFYDRGWHSEPTEDGNYMFYGTIISGAARGADRLAADWAVCNWMSLEEYPAEWDKHGKGAGFIRNQEMLDTGVDLVVAFPGGNGTAHTVRNAKRMGIEVLEIA